MPHDKIEALRNELSRMKTEHKPLDKANSGELMESISNLTETLDHFMQLFQNAIEEMKIEEREEELIVTELQPLHEKLDLIIDQNQKIAQGIVTLADMFKDQRIRAPTLEIPSSSLFSAPPPETQRPMPPPPPLSQKRNIF